MTDTHTPPAITPEQRAELINEMRYNSDTIYSDTILDQLEADGVTIAALTAERDALAAAQADLKAADAQIELLLKNHNGLTAEIARLTAALATAREDGMREGKSLHRIADFIDDQVKVTRETMRQASLGRNDMSLLEIGTSHFLDCARDIRKAAIAKGAAT